MLLQTGMLSQVTAAFGAKVVKTQVQLVRLLMWPLDRDILILQLALCSGGGLSSSLSHVHVHMHMHIVRYPAPNLGGVTAIQKHS